MHAFTYHSPTEIIFGKDTQLQLAQQIRKYGGNRVLLVYGSGSIERSGLLNQLCQILTDNQIPYELFGGVKANPTLEHAREGVKLALKCGADFVIGAGGGSVIDTAKAIAIGAANVPADIWEFWTREKTPHHALPVGAVLTISAAGSESSDSAVLTNLATGVKRGLGTELNRPRFAIMNPELTMTLPPYQVACGVTDIMMHTMDRYFNPYENELTDAIAEALLRTVIAKGRVAVQNPKDYDSMSELMWAGSLSHNGLTGLGGMKDLRCTSWDMNSLPCLTPPTVLLWLPSGVPGRRLFTRQNRPASRVSQEMYGVSRKQMTPKPHCPALRKPWHSSVPSACLLPWKKIKISGSRMM